MGRIQIAINKRLLLIIKDTQLFIFFDRKRYTIYNSRKLNKLRLQNYSHFRVISCFCATKQLHTVEDLHGY
jgi:hypothetical protein